MLSPGFGTAAMVYSNLSTAPSVPVDARPRAWQPSRRDRGLWQCVGFQLQVAHAAPQACSPAFQNARQRSRTVCSRRRTALSRQTETLFVGFPAHQSVPAVRVAVALENLAKPNEHLLQRP